MKKSSFPPSFIEDKVEALSAVQRLLILVVTVGLICVAYYFLSYEPQTKEITKINRSITKQKQRLAELKKVEQDIKRFRMELQVALEKLNELRKELPNEKEVPGLLKNVSDEGINVGLTNVLFQPQPERVIENTVAEIPVRLDMIGQYHQVALFFDKISKLDRILQVKKVNLTRTGGTNLSVNCMLATYRFLPDRALQEGAAPADDKKAAGKKKKKGK